MARKQEKIVKNLGYILKKARLNRGYTREQLSERTGISVRYLTAIENEQKRPSYDVLYLLLHNLGISADCIFYPEKPDEAEEQYMLRLLQQCSNRDKKVVQDLINSMLNNT